MFNYFEGMCCFFAERLTYVSILILASSSKNCSLQESHSSKTIFGTFTLPFFVLNVSVFSTRLILILPHNGHESHLDFICQPFMLIFLMNAINILYTFQEAFKGAFGKCTTPYIFVLQIKNHIKYGKLPAKKYVE